MSIEKIEQALIGYWGERCTDFDAGCPCCLAWKEYDRLREAERKAQDDELSRLRTALVDIRIELIHGEGDTYERITTCKEIVERALSEGQE